MTQFNRRQWLKTASIAGVTMSAAGCKLKAESNPTVDSKPIIDQIVKLSSNENRFAPSAKIKEAMIGAMDKSYLYPPAHYGTLIDAIAAKEDVSRDHILLVSGSNEGLRLTGLIYGMNGGEIITGTPTYKALLSYAEEFGGVINSVPLDKDLKYDLDEVEKRVTPNTKMVFFCNPNNPTGTLVDPQKAMDFCRTVSDKTMVFSDEAYSDYIEEDNYPTMVPLIKEGKNVIVSHTFSKVYGMAGVRVGYLVARPDIIKMMKPRVMSYINMMGLDGAVAALKDQEFYQFSLAKNKEAKEHIYRVADELGMRYVKSHTNFVFVQTGEDASTLAQKMLTHGVKVGRPFPPLTDWCRVSTGTNEDMLAWEGAMKKVFT